jgi:transcriptional/translational regulatory protein YebC/TACO1
MPEDTALEAALDAGATDFVREDSQYVISTEPAAFHTVKAALDARGLKAAEAEVAWIAKQTVRVEGADARALIKLIESLEELDDVQKVDANFDMDVAELEAS